MYILFVMNIFILIYIPVTVLYYILTLFQKINVNVISQNLLIAHHKSFGCATIACRKIKHALWCAIATRVAFYSWPGMQQ